MVIDEKNPLVNSYSKLPDYPSTTNLTDGSSCSTDHDDRELQGVLNSRGLTKIRAYFILALGSMAMSDSCQSTFLGITLPAIRCQWNMDPYYQGLMTASIFAAQGVGAIVIGTLSDRYGRKLTSIGTIFGVLLFMFLTSIAPNSWFFILVASCAAFAAGGSMSISYTYWAEVSADAHRSKGVLGISMLWNGGMLMTFLLAYLIINSAGWRIFVAILALPNLIPLFLMFILPESPKYLSTHGHQSAMIESVRSITGSSEKEAESWTFRSEVVPSESNSILNCMTYICGKDNVSTTLQVIAVYCCNMILFKGAALFMAIIIAVNYCGMGTVQIVEDTSEEVSEMCQTLTDNDLLNGMGLAVALYPATLSAVMLSEKIGKLVTLRLLSVMLVVVLSALLFCLGKFLMYVVCFFVIVFITAVCIVMYLILPDMYPTIARNSGFGLVDGVGKTVAAVAVFGITALFNYSIRSCIGVFIFIAIVQVIFAMKFKYHDQTVQELDHIKTSESETD